MWQQERPESSSLSGPSVEGTLLDDVAGGIGVFDGSDVELLECRFDLSPVSDGNDDELIWVDVLFRDACDVGCGDGGVLLRQGCVVVERTVEGEDGAGGAGG